MGQLVQFNSALITITCWAREGCGIQFGIPQEFDKSARQHGHAFHCPRGHALSYGESDVSILKNKLEEQERRTALEKSRRESAEREEARARKAEKTAKTKLKNQSERIKNGVCPCCNRTFQNLQRHMNTKHPKWSAEHT